MFLIYVMIWVLCSALFLSEHGIRYFPKDFTWDTPLILAKNVFQGRNLFGIILSSAIWLLFFPAPLLLLLSNYIALLGKTIWNLGYKKAPDKKKKNNEGLKGRVIGNTVTGKSKFASIENH